MPDPEMTRRRLAILQHVSSGLDRYQEICALIAGADNRAAARRAVQDLLGCDELSARAITDAQLEQLSKERRAELAAEIEFLKEAID